MSSTDLDQRFQSARRNYASGQDAVAESGYRDVLRGNPNHAGASFGLGVIELRSNRFAAALGSLGHATKLQPNWPEAHNAMGSVLMSLRRFDEAIERFRLASSLAPGRAIFLKNLGLALIDNQQFDEAIVVFGRSIAIDARDPLLHHNLACALRKVGRIDEAMMAYGQAIVLKRDYAAAYVGLGATLMKRGRVEEALAVAKKASELEPTLAEAHGLRGYALGTLGRQDEARLAYAEALKQKPGSENFRFHHAAFSNDRSIRTAPASTVRELFDEYAPTFDSHLQEALSYRIPEILFDLVRASEARSELNVPNLDVLDLGCGTGLCGVRFRPISRRITGIDLSPGMLSRAAERGIYDELIEADLTTSLQKKSDRYDLAIAADVFIYVGDLSEVFPAIVGVLKPNGLLAFSIERSESEDVVLNTTCRFSHSLKYIRDLAGQCSLDELAVQEVPIRKNGEDAIPGFAIVLRKRG